jgi:hypothetical protein
MRRRSHVLALLLACVTPLAAQQWQPGSALPLVRSAVMHRVARDNDSLLGSWSAAAHGVVRFASVLDHGTGPVERVMKADELRVEVYGEVPNRSKQIILAWRDTTFLPTGIRYHRDHLGIVANDFGSTIRLGEGDEVRDLIHPLSLAGLDYYRFALGDTVTLAGPHGTVRVVAVAVRPANPAAPGTVGTLYLDVDRAALVRFRFTFTPAAYRDATVEDITVTLENALQENARWLPWRQSIVIRRSTTWIDLPLHTVLRGDWTIDNYQLGVPQPPERFVGPFIGGLRDPAPGAVWTAPLAAALDSMPVAEADVAAEQREASAALGGKLLDGLPRFRFFGHGVSDLLHINRVEGITPALGAQWTIGRLLALRARAGYGFSDQRVIGDASLDLPVGGAHVTVSGGRTVTDVVDHPTFSGAVNSLTTGVDGDDHGDYLLLERVAASVRTDMGRGVTVHVTAARERTASVASAFTPLLDSVTTNPALGAGSAWMGELELGRPAVDGDGWQLALERGQGDATWWRADATVQGRTTAGPGTLQFDGEAGAGTSGLPAYRSFVVDGPGWLPVVPDRSLGGRRMARAELAWQFPVALPTPPFPYSHLVRLPSTIGPLLAAGVAGGTLPLLPWQGTGRIEPVGGVRLDLWGPLLRLECGFSLRTGRAALAIDVHPDWWGLL